MKHTEEPWAIGKTHVILEGGHMPRGNTFILDMVPLSLDNFDRAAICVNAMQGIEDVDEFMYKLKHELLSINNQLAVIDRYRYDITRDETTESLKECVTKALVLFPKEHGKA